MVTVVASHGTSSAPCPDCSHPSRRIHSRYTRKLADLPWANVPVRLRISVRKLYCDNPACPRRIFAERLGGVAKPYARRTDRHAEALELVALALGGRAGARLAAKLGLPASRDTLLRCVRRLPLPTDRTPRVLGVDDWSLRRGQTFGTILVDLERHRVIDLLPDRAAETLAAWLRRHPHVQVVARDRSGAYADGIAQGAPAAVQVADRWHLAKNLGDALEELFSRNRSCLTNVRPAAPAGTAHARAPSTRRWDVWSGASPLAGSRAQKQTQRARREERLERYRQLMRLRERGVTIKGAARAVGIGERTANRWIAAGAYPERRVRRRTHRELDEHEGYIRKRWEEGCRNRTQLWRELCERGYTGPRHSIYQYIVRLKEGLLATTRDRPSPAHAAPTGGRRLSPRRAAWLLLRRRETLDDTERAVLHELLDVCSDAATAYPLVRDFLHLLRERKGDELDSWLDRVEESGVRELKSFAAGLRRDEAAVRAGLTLPYSNGQTEGHVNRLKLLKRQGYGRANFDLLKKRVLRAA